jgi:hypothetical protein
VDINKAKVRCERTAGSDDAKAFHADMVALLPPCAFATCATRHIYLPRWKAFCHEKVSAQHT